MDTIKFRESVAEYALTNTHDERIRTVMEALPVEELPKNKLYSLPFL